MVPLIAVSILAAIAAPAAQQIDAGAIFRVFLTTGPALPSYGESAVVGDRVVFTLLVSATGPTASVQLMSLPASRVDLVRTRRYADAIRARHYADTRGEVDYAAMTQEVQRTLTQLTSIEDPKRRLELAEEAKRRLLAWSSSTYGYRAADVRELSGLFDEVIAELRAATGQRAFAIDLRSGPEDLAPEPLLAPPTLAESLQLALVAAQAADNEDDRAAVLRVAESLAATEPAAAAAHAAMRRELDLDAAAAAAYPLLFDSVRAQADAARRRGDVGGVEAAISSLRSRDVALGSRRPAGVEALARDLDAVLEATRTYRAALDRYARVRGSLLQYERLVRPVMSGFDGLLPVFGAVRDFKFTAYERLDRAGHRLRAFRAALSTLEAPDDLADVHATLASALQMAEYACARRRLAFSTSNAAMDREASSAAAGAMMLAELARGQLVARLYPPKIQ